MALGGGTFTTQNKILPGAYINVISAAGSVVMMGERGTVALPIALNWGKSGVFTVTAEEFQRDSMKIFGYAYTADEMQPLREVFKHAQKVHVYNTIEIETQASCKYATAKNYGARGNDLKVVIQQNIDDESMFDVSLYLGTTLVDKQTVATASELKENDFVTWESTDLAVEAGVNFSGGISENSDFVSGTEQNALNAFESYSFNVLVCPDDSVGSLFVEYTKRMRDTQGVKFQLVGVNLAADYEGVISIDPAQANALCWVAGAQAGCAINQSCTNMEYDGEMTIATPHTQRELEDNILSGVFTFHKVDDEVRVLMDVNTLVTYTDEKSKLFAHNQTVRVTDQRHNDVKRIFNKKYLGKIQNDSDGRASFWGDVVKLSEEYAQMRAIEPYDSKSLTVELGDTPNSIVVRDGIKVIGTMEQLYMTIVCN